jgi:hypothetical protein
MSIGFSKINLTFSLKNHVKTLDKKTYRFLSATFRFFRVFLCQNAEYGMRVNAQWEQCTMGAMHNAQCTVRDNWDALNSPRFSVFSNKRKNFFKHCRIESDFIKI